MNVFLLYSGDIWLHPMSLSLMAVCTDKEAAIKIAVEASGYAEVPLDEMAQAELRDKNQTDRCEENFLIVPVELNELI
ncbi:MAG: hypothetical protein NC418_06245 [Muribaculaceae bacterium]|nr:hypothetical protein [Muribaculaceae bacterium]